MGPLDPEEEERKARRESRQAWRTPIGFQTAGLHSMGTTRPLGLPPISAATEVGGKSGAGVGAHRASPDLLPPTQEWREKALFANLLEPVLQRERWGWDQRHQDFDLYTRPPTFLELPPAPKPRAGENGARALGGTPPRHPAPSLSAMRGRGWEAGPRPLMLGTVMPTTTSRGSLGSSRGPTCPCTGKGHDDPCVLVNPLYMRRDHRRL